MDLRALPRRGQFPVAVEIAVPVEPAPETRLFVAFGEVGKVCFAEPMRQRAIGARGAEKSLAVLDEQRSSGTGIRPPVGMEMPAMATPPS